MAGVSTYHRTSSRNSTHICLLPENYWANKAQRSREDELKWRVKDNILSTSISFIWSAVLLITFRIQRSTKDFFQDMDAVCNGSNMFPVLHVACRTKIDCG